jgi:hypothetical protein
MYSATNMLRIPTSFHSSSKKGLLNIFKSIQEALSDSISLVLTVPNTAFIRTEIICKHISKEVGVPFVISDFLMYLFNDFSDKCVEKYDTRKLYNELICGLPNDKYAISINNQVYEVERNNCNKVILEFKMLKDYACNGSLLLAELNEFYRHNLTLDDMVISLWLNFIDAYMNGDSNKLVKTIINYHKKRYNIK